MKIFLVLCSLERLHLCREERERIIDRNNPVENSNSEDDYVVEEEELESDESFVGENTSQGWHVLNPDEDGICMYFHNIYIL